MNPLMPTSASMLGPSVSEPVLPDEVLVLEPEVVPVLPDALVLVVVLLLAFVVVEPDPEPVVPAEVPPVLEAWPVELECEEVEEEDEEPRSPTFAVLQPEAKKRASTIEAAIAERMPHPSACG
jgi:hypothetical protein